ncbi:hypothetical protein C5167_026705 [Papaver somniferum]|nr:hypothetical protein C5167_026705 [Papaver somniferum]
MMPLKFNDYILHVPPVLNQGLFSHVKVEGSSDTDEHHHVTKKPYHDEICQLDESPVKHEHWHTTL